ncbi:MAG: hypothetical protein J6B60_01935 [Clostridia bacterium]|nr:hypothetical protein [Clostridia bacterium]
MRKKLFLFVAMAAMLMCLFAITSSAAEPSYKDGEWIYASDGTTKLAIRDTDGNPLIWYMNGDELKWVRADQTDITQPVYVKYKIEAGGSGFSGVSPQKTLKDIDIYDNSTQIECAGINSALVLINLEKLDIDALNGWLWGNKHGCCLLMRGIVLPSSLKYIGQEGFTNTRLVQIWNLENTQLEYINNSSFATTVTLTQEATNGVFKSPQTMPISAQNSSIKQYYMHPMCTFNTCQKWYQLFRNCKQLEKIIVPSHFEIGFGEEAFYETPKQYILFITGTEEQATNLRDNTQSYRNGNFTSAKVISYEIYLADQTTYDNATNQVYIVYGYNFCDAFYEGAHDLSNDDGLCSTETKCARKDCGIVAIEAQEHKLNITMSYNDGYGAAGTKVCDCPNENCTKEDGTFTLDPIFVAEGYSIREDGKSLLGGYRINSDALKAYNEYTGTKLTYGIVMSNAANVVITNGKYTGGKGLMVSESNESYTTVKYVVSGFSATKELTDLGLVISLYVVDGNGMSFIQNDTAYDSANANVDGANTAINAITFGYIAQKTLNEDEAIGEDYKSILEAIIKVSETTALPVQSDDE